MEDQERKIVINGMTKPVEQQNLIIQGTEKSISFYTRLIKAKNEFQPAKRETQGFGYKYADLQEVITATDTALHKYNILVWEEQINDNIKIYLVDTETGDMYLRYDKDIVSVQMAKANEIQQEGAGITYLRRYGRLVVLGIAPEDDDANSADRKLLGDKGKKKQKYTPEQLKSWHEEVVKLNNDGKVQEDDIVKLSELKTLEIKDDYGDLLFSIIRDSKAKTTEKPAE